MILNANIPLNTSPTIRQPRWRIGLFLGLSIIGLLMGWIMTKRLFTGMITPELKTSSGITIRITPEHALWIATHTAGLSINADCPIDLPTLISYKTTSWIILGDTGTNTQTVIMGKVPDALKNYSTAFSCAQTTLKKGYALQKKEEETPKVIANFPLFTPDGWAWNSERQIAIKLYERGVNIAFPYNPKEKIPWPEQTLTAALPITKTAFDILPETAQGLTDILQKGGGMAYFSWKTPDNKTAIGFSFATALTDDELIALFSVITDSPVNEQKIFREDNVGYWITVQEPLSLVWADETNGEIQTTSNNATVGYVTRTNNETYVSTSPTTWTSIIPHWEAPLGNKNEKNSHTKHTLANFGEQMFFTRNLFTVFQREM